MLYSTILWLRICVTYFFFRMTFDNAGKTKNDNYSDDDEDKKNDTVLAEYDESFIARPPSPPTPPTPSPPSSPRRTVSGLFGVLPPRLCCMVFFFCLCALLLQKCELFFFVVKVPTRTSEG